ncbi:hypothetical protein [Nonlabens ulvanivorans]|uniref:Uncharacterized protein n=2 Tax=Nonlabens ulvanivorans TaxID=906888 RepID=A0ABX5E224_NONUL|nr:hypothetical protein [Nonlabens ulvanivorans]PRX12467.1 hypothetical protein LY02_02532 [Nonlabens ulvanivorans]
MLNKIEFSDLYRFLTSIGLIFIASSFIIPWLFMKQELGVISSTDYNGLIQSSKDLVDNRISLNLIVIKALPFISIGLFLFGCLLIFIGFKKWKKKQDGIDETDGIKLELLRATKQLDSEEIDEKAEMEVQEEIQESTSSEKIKDEKPKAKSKEEIEKLKTNLIGMEKLFYDKIIEFNSFAYEPKANVKIDDKFEADIVLTPNNKRKNPDIIIEVKYLQTKLNMDIVKKSFSALVRMRNHIFNSSKRSPTLILIMVYRSDIGNADEIRRFKNGVVEYLSQFSVGTFRHFILNEQEAENFNINTIIR